MNCIDCKDFTCPHRSESTVGKNCYYESGDEQKEKLLMMSAEASLHYADWSSFRREAAKDILCALVSDGRTSVNAESVKNSIALADELIRQLKQE